MKFFNYVFFLTFLFINGCASISYIEKKDGQYQIRPLSEKERSGNLSITQKFPAYNRGKISDKAKFFLVAASSGSANFLQEIVEQKKILLSLGYQENEIVCYYVVPTDKEFKQDKNQFESLTEDVGSFYLASPRNLFAHLKKASNSDISFLYVYITSHGSKPQGETMHDYYRSKYKFSKEPHKQIDFLTKQFPDYYNQYFIRFDAMSSGRVNYAMQLHALKRKQSPADIILTPRYLKQILSEVRVEVKKYIILQGCYTGSFISTNNMALKQDTLKSVPNICLMTASRHDRSSFGCAPGPDRTYFGGTFNDLLKSQKQRLELITWNEFYRKIKDKIEIIELREKIHIKRRSLPSYFSNIDT